MKIWVVTYPDGRQRQVKAERYQIDNSGAATFYDEDGDEVITLASGWHSIEPKAS